MVSAQLLGFKYSAQPTGLPQCVTSAFYHYPPFLNRERMSTFRSGHIIFKCEPGYSPGQVKGFGQNLRQKLGKLRFYR